jgi:hypothetical protein
MSLTGNLNFEPANRQNIKTTPIYDINTIF